MTAPPRRIMLDVTTLVRWVGPPVGIVRVEHALAMAALGRDDTVLVLEGSATGTWHGLAPRWAAAVLGWSGLVDRHEPRGMPRDLLSRQGIVMALERLRLATPWPWLARLADRSQRAILALRPHRFPLLDSTGRRIANVPRAWALGARQDPGPGDILVLAGSGWSPGRAAWMAERKVRDGFAIAAICYDLIPITHPEFFREGERRNFAAHWRAMLPLLDRLLVTSSAIARDVTEWAGRNDLAVPPITVVPLGFDPPAPAETTTALPAGLAAGRYALFVSTLEPRKGHAMLLAAWDMLLASGLPQRLGFQLVFAGRPGWMVDGVLQRLAQGVEGVVHLPAAGNDVVSALYRHAAFCCYPSRYEGYGLPLIEAFAHGRAVLASTGGALAETGAGFARALPPLDSEAWAAAMAEWMENPDAVRVQEAHIAANFRHPAWPEAAASILSHLAEGPPDEPACPDTV